MNSPYASTRNDLRSGCGCETTLEEASRLSLKAAATASASGEPAAAVYLVFFAINCTCEPYLRNSTTCDKPAG